MHRSVLGSKSDSLKTFNGTLRVNDASAKYGNAWAVHPNAKGPCNCETFEPTFHDTG